MLWPLMLADRKGATVKNRFPLYLGTQVTLLDVGMLGALQHSISKHSPCGKLRAVPDQRLLHPLHGAAGVQGGA